MYRRGGAQMYIRFWWGDGLEDAGIYERIILK